MDILIPTRKLIFTNEQKARWKDGQRDDCADPYCRKLPGTSGFGEYIAGQFYESLGYAWIHHDFNLLGGNKLGKYPRAEAILRSYFGDERFERGRQLYASFSPFVDMQEPDLLLYKPDGSDLRFAECKRDDTGDKLNDSQVRGLALLRLLFDCPVEVVHIVEKGREDRIADGPLRWAF
ncbi:hypothetical protein B5M42_013790 [Paenibacillus athensensis]|uniref:VRR-NUC domain-containing protein n=1 Tax=Paenibacillus athensensis TaxID=1967502 RepID=A0A4Y8PY97_9BACL|nr:hypothetical protein [Paenibacillus athensensis]MCD1259904.1 hypothetical protein [Paenibacillus athensensis]